jgi:hypothetical protein
MTVNFQMLNLQPLRSPLQAFDDSRSHVGLTVRALGSHQTQHHLARQQIMPDQYSVSSEGDSQAEFHLARDSFRYAKKQRASGAAERPLVLANVRCAANGGTQTHC